MEVIEESDGIFKKTLTRWINYKLSNDEEEVQDLFVDLRDGLKLRLLLQNLFDDFGIEGKGDPFELVEKSLRYIFKKFGSCNASAELIIAGDKNSTSELIWHVIYNHEIAAIIIETDEGDLVVGPRAILRWVKDHVPNLQISDFEDSWKDGAAILTLVNNILQNEGVQETYLTPQEKWKKSFNLAQASLGIPKLLDAEDQISDELNGRNLLTYLAVLYNKWSKICETRKAEEQRNLAQENYFNTSRNLLDWVKERTNRLLKADLASDAAAISNELKALQEEISSEKKARSLQHSELSELYNFIKHEESFTSYASLSEIEAAWKEMERAERQREYNLALSLRKFEHCKDVEAKYEDACEKREAFFKGVLQKLQENDEIDTEMIVRQYAEFEEVGRLAQQLLETNHPKTAWIRDNEREVEEKWRVVQNVAKSYDKKQNFQTLMVKIRSIGDYLSVMEKKFYGKFENYNELYAKLDIEKMEEDVYKHDAKNAKILNNIYAQCQQDFGNLLREMTEVNQLVKSDIKEVELLSAGNEEVNKLLQAVTCKKLHELMALIEKECNNYKLHSSISKVFEFLKNKEALLKDGSIGETQIGELLEELEAYSLPTDLQEQAVQLGVNDSKYELTVLKHQQLQQKLKAKLGDLRFESFNKKCEEFKDWIDDCVLTVNAVNYMMIKRGGDKKFKELNREAEAQTVLPNHNLFTDRVQEVAKHWLEFSVAFSEKNKKDIERPPTTGGLERTVWKYFMCFLFLIVAMFAIPFLKLIYFLSLR